MPKTPHPDMPEGTYGMYIDESGDHTFGDFAATERRFLCLLGCWFKNPAHTVLEKKLEALKARHFCHNPAVVLDRRKIIGATGDFSVLREPRRRADFDNELLQVVSGADFGAAVVVVDKKTLWLSMGNAAEHPYHLALRLLLQQYAGFLNSINCKGDVIAESRDAKENRLLENAYAYMCANDTWLVKAKMLRAALSSSKLKLLKKSANVAGLQLADLLANPAKHWVLRQKYGDESGLSPFVAQLMAAVADKFNHHIRQDEDSDCVFYSH